MFWVLYENLRLVAVDQSLFDALIFFHCEDYKDVGNLMVVVNLKLLVTESLR